MVALRILDLESISWEGAIIAAATAATHWGFERLRRKLLAMEQPAPGQQEVLDRLKPTKENWRDGDPLSARLTYLAFASPTDWPWAKGEYTRIVDDTGVDGWIRLRAATEAYRTDPEFGCLLLEKLYEGKDLHELVRLAAADELCTRDPQLGALAYRHLLDASDIDPATEIIVMLRLGAIPPERAAAALLFIINDASHPLKGVNLAVQLCAHINAPLQIQALWCIVNNSEGTEWRRFTALLWLAALGQEVRPQLRRWIQSETIPPMLRALCLLALTHLNR